MSDSRQERAGLARLQADLDRIERVERIADELEIDHPDDRMLMAMSALLAPVSPALKGETR